MTNFEKVKEMLTIEDMVTNPCKVIHRLRNEDGCAGIRFCEECRKWLEEDYKEPIILTEAERIILENVDKGFKYIARDGDGTLYIHRTKPIIKKNYIWCSGSGRGLGEFNHLFQFIKWEDEEPYEIAKLLEG